MANGFNPLGSFVAGKQAGLGLQQQQLGLQQTRADAPRRNQLADLQLQGAQRQERTAGRQEGVTQESARIKFMNQAGKALLQLPQEQRLQAFSRLEPLSQQVGIETGTFSAERMTDESLNQMINTTQGFMNDPGSLDQQRLQLRRDELSQRATLLEGEAGRKGDIEREKLLAQKGLKADVAGEVAGAQARAKGGEERVQDAIGKGLVAADGTASLRRGIQLLEGIQTGGIDRVALGAKQFFGIESGDEGELVNLLGKAVLSQLRETFGAAFTAQEGQSLKSMEANIGKSPEANKRLLKNALKIAERAANRGIDRAVQAKDFKAAAEIQESLDFILEDLPTAPAQQDATAAPQAPAQRQGGQVMVDADGNRAMVFPDGTFEEL